MQGSLESSAKPRLAPAVYMAQPLSVVWSGRNTSMEFRPILSPLEKAAATTSQSARLSSRTDHRPRTEVLPKPALEALEDQTTHPAGQSGELTYWQESH